MKKIFIIYIYVIFGTAQIFSQSIGDFQTVSAGIFGVSGSWTDVSIWQIFDGTNWVAASGNSVLNGDQYPGQTSSSLRSVTILTNAEITLNGNYRITNLTINSGGKLSVGSTTTQFISIYGDITNNGQIGEISGNDGISLSFEKNGTSVVSGSGSFNLKKILKGITNVTTAVTLNADINVNYSQTAIYNALENSNLNISIASGKTLKVVNGSIAIDDIDGKGTGEKGGKFDVLGTLNVAGTIYLTNNNSSLPCSLVVENGGNVICSNAITSQSGSAGNFLILNSGSSFEITSTNLGEMSAINNTYTFSGEVNYSGTNQTISKATYTDLKLSNSGIKTFNENVIINGNLTLAGTSTISGGNFIDYNNSGTLIYNGSGIQSTSEELYSAQNLNSVIINNLDGVILTNDVTIPGNLTFTNGNLTTNSFKVTLGGTISETDANHLIGSVEKTSSTSTNNVTFGNIGFSISSASALNIGNITVTRVSGDNAIVSVGANNSIKKRYYVGSISNSTSVQVTLKWFPSEDNGKGPNDMAIYKYESSWAKVGNASDVSGSPRSITQSITTLSGTYTVSDISNPLPVELTSFTAKEFKSNVILNWQTATEINNYGFEVQKSNDGSEWIKLGFIPGSGNSNSVKQYSFVDKNKTSQNVFYRLKQIDVDGDYKFLNKIEFLGETPAKMELLQNYPNPFNPSTTIKYTLTKSTHVIIKVFDLLGKEIQELINEEKKAGSYIVEFDANKINGLASGTYIYTLQAGNFFSAKKFILLK